MHCPRNGSELRRRERIGPLENHFEPERLRILARAIERCARVLQVGADQGHATRLGRLLEREIEHAFGVVARRRSLGIHGEVAGILEPLVCTQPEDADGRPVALDDRRHGRRDDVGAVGPDQQIDFVDRHEFRVDGWGISRVALVVVVDELHRPAQKPAFGIDIVAPDFETGEHLFARRRGGAGQADTQSDADRIRRAYRHRDQNCSNRCRNEHQHSRHAMPCARPQMHSFLPVILERVLLKLKPAPVYFALALEEDACWHAPVSKDEGGPDLILRDASQRARVCENQATSLRCDAPQHEVAGSMPIQARLPQPCRPHQDVAHRHRLPPSTACRRDAASVQRIHDSAQRLGARSLDGIRC